MPKWTDAAADTVEREDGTCIDMSDETRWEIYAADGTVLAMVEPGDPSDDPDPEASARAWCDSYVEDGAVEARAAPIEAEAAEEVDPMEEVPL